MKTKTLQIIAALTIVITVCMAFITNNDFGDQGSKEKNGLNQPEIIQAEATPTTAKTFKKFNR